MSDDKKMFLKITGVILAIYNVSGLSLVAVEIIGVNFWMLGLAISFAFMFIVYISPDPELFGNNKTIDSTIKKYPFHGGCMCCTKFHKHGHSYCNNCRYYKDNLNLKDIGNSIENFSNYSNRNIKSLSDKTIENHINNLTIQEALDIVDKKVEGRNNA